MDKSPLKTAKTMAEQYLFHSKEHEQAFFDSPDSEIVQTERAVLFIEYTTPLRQVYYAYETPEDLRRALGGLAGVSVDLETFRLAASSTDFQVIESMKKTLKRAGAEYQETNLGMRDTVMHGKRGLDTSVVSSIHGMDDANTYELITKTIGKRQFAMGYDTFKIFMNEPSTIALGIREHGTVIAFALGIINEKKSQLFIRGLGVHQDHHKKGYGKMLLQSLLDKGREYELNHAMLWVEDTNKRAIKLYESFGFELNGEKEAIFTYRPRMHASY